MTFNFHVLVDHTHTHTHKYVFRIRKKHTTVVWEEGEKQGKIINSKEKLPIGA